MDKKIAKYHTADLLSFISRSSMDMDNHTISDWELPDCKVTEFKPKHTKYCFVVVIWNEGDRIKKQLAEMKQNAPMADIIIADGNSSDGSTDHSFLMKQDIRALLITKETGLCTATRMGLAYALIQGYEGVVTVDGNGKDGIEALPRFLAELDKGYDLIQGSRFMKGGYHKNTPLSRLVSIRYIFSPILSIASGYWFTDPINAFRAISRKFLLDNRVQPFRKIFIRFNLQMYLDYRAAKLNYKIKEIPVERVYPDNGSVPTKIHGFSNLIVVWEMLKVAFGHYDAP
jgi:dolichol-phosphate mannosyltransferase